MSGIESHGHCRSTWMHRSRITMQFTTPDEVDRKPLLTQSPPVLHAIERDAPRPQKSVHEATGAFTGICRKSFVFSLPLIRNIHKPFGMTRRRRTWRLPFAAAQQLQSSEVVSHIAWHWPGSCNHGFMNPPVINIYIANMVKIDHLWLV